MALSDHDQFFADENFKHKPMPEPVSRLTWLVALLTAAFALYFAVDWWLDFNNARSAASTRAAQARAGRPANTPLATTPDTPVLQPGRTVTKCVLAGRTTYLDGDCPAGATASRVQIPAGMNVSDAASTPPMPAAPSLREQVARTAAMNPDAATIALQCQALKDEVTWVDDRAKLPQTPQELERLAALKRLAASQQADLKC